VAEPAIGSTLGGYRVDALIARGGMGIVYRATHLALERQVALKVIARHLADDDSFRERFLRESRLAARLDHPSVVPVYDAREEEGELIVAMRLVEGGDLKRRIAARGPLPPAEAIELLGQVASALDTAHAAGIVHRDVKPHNILIEGDRAFLTDFGLAKALGDSGVLDGASIAGTVEYMSPEQWQGRSVGPPADVYSLGCVLYEALTGIVPYARQAEDTEPEIPEGLDSVIERAVAKDPTRRFPSAGGLIEAARERQGGAPAATRVLSDTPGRPTAVIGEGRRPGASRGRRPRIRVRTAVLAAAALFAAILIAFVVHKLGTDRVEVSDPIQIGRGPLRIATGERSVWVTSAREGTLSRIDSATGLVSGEPLRLVRGVAGVAVGERSVWVASPRTGEVLRIDGDAGTVEDRIQVGGRPGALVFGGDRIWVADQGGRGVTAINARGGRVFRRGIAPHTAPLRLAVGAGAVWVSSAGTGSVRRIDLGSGAAGPPALVGRGPSGVTVAGGVVWVANSRSDSVTRIDPVTRALLGEPITVGGRPGGIDAGTSVVWVANAEDDTVSRIDIESGEVSGDPVGVGSHPGAVVVAREAVWVADNGEGSVTRIEP
jgi:DNA-binding beta-propeller fold protein YncE/tRNA A-37 threonylcarbamoyl transferase component Bud32